MVGGFVASRPPLTRYAGAPLEGEPLWVATYIVAPLEGSPACRKASLCETDSPDTGEVALAPEGERCPEGAEGENLAIARNISDSRTTLSPTACGRSPLAEGAKG